jgi:hypothetical protein
MYFIYFTMYFTLTLLQLLYIEVSSRLISLKKPKKKNPQKKKSAKKNSAKISRISSKTPQKAFPLIKFPLIKFPLISNLRYAIQGLWRDPAHAFTMGGLLTILGERMLMGAKKVKAGKVKAEHERENFSDRDLYPPLTVEE